jgi:hypothetical protein
MTEQERTFLLAEKSTLERLLEDIPREAVLERPGLEARLGDVQEHLATADPPGREPARARLTFRGRPVVGHYGIFAEFGASATSAFTDAVAKVAAGLTGPLAPMGPIPNRQESQMLITSTAIGSFGFELEEHRSGQIEFGEVSPVAQALDMTRNLLQSTLGSDDELADSAVGTDPRAVEALRWFLDLLASNEAICVLECSGKVFRFVDVGQVRHSAQRLGRDNLREELTQLKGEFQGVLPGGRTFEFRLAEGGDVVRGKVGPAISDPDLINRHLHELVTIEVLATRVANGRPRYALIAIPAWGGE